MRQLWVRFSLIIGAFFLVLLLIPTGSLLVLDQAGVISITDDGPDEEDILEDIFEALLIITTVVSVVGLTLGIFLSRGLTTPIVDVIAVVKQIGAGDLDQQVPATNHSQELNELAQAVNTMAADLQKSETLRSNMLADISHELRTPLTVLSGQLRASLDNVYELSEEEIASLYVQTQHLIRLVEDLRVLAQAEANQLSLVIINVDLAGLLNDISNHVAPLAHEKGLTFSLATAETQMIVSADRDRLRQLFTNLLINAVDHTPKDGSIEFNLEKEGNWVRVQVIDSGEGIAAEHVPHLFDRFYRVDSSRSRETGGSGLGLAIAKAIVETHAGKIEAQSEGLGQGATFTVWLPFS